MASAWGASWGAAWGNAWGTITSASTPDGAGGGGLVYFTGQRLPQPLRAQPKKPKKPESELEDEELLALMLRVIVN